MTTHLLVFLILLSVITLKMNDLLASVQLYPGICAPTQPHMNGNWQLRARKSATRSGGQPKWLLLSGYASKEAALSDSLLWLYAL